MGARTVLAWPADGLRRRRPGRLRHHWPATPAQYFVAMAMTTSSAIGVPRRRSDGEAKVRGQTRYVGDMPVYGLLHARPVLAAEAHARLDGSTAAAALAVPGVVAVLTAADLPLSTGGSGRAAEPLAREEIVWSGQPVALVIAETEAAAEDGAALVFVDAEPLPAVLDLEAAMAAGAAAARGSTRRATAGRGGAHARRRRRRGRRRGGALGQRRRPPAADRAATSTAALAGADRASPPAASARAGSTRPTSSRSRRWRGSSPTARSSCSSSTQGAFMAAPALADCSACRSTASACRPAPLGGAFGGKLMISEPLAAAAALTLKRPVRLVFGRSEDFAAANPAPGQLIDLELGATRDGDADRDPRPDRRRPRRAGGDGRRDDRHDALRRAVPLARARPDRARRGHQPRQRGRLPRAGRAAGGVRGRDADRPARGRAGARPDRAAAAERAARRATTASTGRRSSSSARASASSACARTRCGSAAASCPTTRASASRSASGPAAWSPRPRSASSTPTAS